MPTTTLVLNGSKNLSLQTRRGRAALTRVANRVAGILSGAENETSWQLINDETALGTAGVKSRAAGVCLMASSTGTVGVVINGTTVSVTWATSDTVSQGLLATAINANTTVNKFVKATRYVGALALSSVVAGTTVTICGQVFTATSAATSKLNEFDISGTNAQDASALAAAINANPFLGSKLVAVADGSAATVYLGLIEDRAPRTDEVMTASATTVTVTAFSTGAASMTYAIDAGAMGNCCTFTATGTNVSVKSAVSGKLGGALAASSTATGFTVISNDTK